jgi:hypothetical protein
MNVWVLLAMIGGLIILGLALYAGWLFYLLHQRREQQSALQRRHDAENQRMHEDRMRSVELLCTAALAGDCNLSEACIRLHHLLAYYPGLQAQAPVALIASMYEEVADFATHEARLALPASELQRQDDVRAGIEARYRGTLLVELRKLKESASEWRRMPFDMADARTSRAV